MTWQETPIRKYYEKYERVEVKNDFDWYTVYRLPHNVYAIAEPDHFQEVNLFLIMGSERAVLLDTGMGIFPSTPLVKELYDGEIMVVNSHFHFDHIGCNSDYPQVWANVTPYVANIAAKGLKPENMGNQLDESMFRYGYPHGFDPKVFRVKPFVSKALEEHQIIDLGDRKLEVLFTPGHSEDCIMLYDKGNKILFTGDMFYMGCLYAHFHAEEFGNSDVKIYRDTMKRLAEMIPPDVSLYCSHNDFIAPVCKLKETYEMLDANLDASPTESTVLDDAHRYLEKDSVLIECKGDGFSCAFVKGNRHE